MSDSFLDKFNREIHTESVSGKELDAYAFITSEHFLNVDLRPWQSVQIKTFYNLWQKYPPTEEELQILNLLEREWQISIDTVNPTHKREMVLVDGRRSGKSTLMSFIASYETYSLICKDDPQDYYKLMTRDPIYILHIAVSGDQASDMFQFTKNRLRSCKFFEPYFDWTKYNESEMRIFTPYDLRQNDIIKAENAKKKRGEPKQALLEGSIIIKSITTKASTSRGKGTKVLIFSEFGHFDRPKFDSIFKDNAISDETQQTDYAMWKALTPSVYDFKEDGKILYESSPRERGGQFYQLYCDAGGKEQEHPEQASKPSYLALMQLATWEANESIPYEALADKFRQDPVGSNMEYGAHFGNPSGSFITEAVINSIPQPGVMILRKNDNLNNRFVISVDPGGQAKKKISDTYVVSWGHYAIGSDIFWVDGLQGWDEQHIPDGMGHFQKKLVDSDEVIAFIIDLANDLGRNFLMEIVYDQFNSAQAISTLQKVGLPALETFFTNQYKAEMYGNFLNLANQGKVKSYSTDTNGYIDRWKTELKYLQRYISAGTVYYSHPTSGPCIHDDYADACSNLIYRLSMLYSPTRQSLQDRVRHNLAPTVRPKSITPVKAGKISGPGGSARTQRPSDVYNKIKNR